MSKPIDNAIFKTILIQGGRVRVYRPVRNLTTEQEHVLFHWLLDQLNERDCQIRWTETEDGFHFVLRRQSRWGSYRVILEFDETDWLSAWYHCWLYKNDDPTEFTNMY